MRVKLVAIATVLVVNGCSTPDDVRKTGVVWSGTVAARYDQLARCMSEQATPYYKASLQLDPNEHRATVSYLVPVTGTAVEVYDVRQTTNDAAEVSWQTRLEQQGAHDASWSPLDLMRRCGATPLSANPSAVPLSPHS